MSWAKASESLEAKAKELGVNLYGDGLPEDERQDYLMNEKQNTLPTYLNKQPRNPADIAHDWLKKNLEKRNGHISTWEPKLFASYNRDLGLLVEFATDCWPKNSK